MASFDGELNGISYSLHGPADAPVVTLSNSLSTDRTMWDGQAPALSARYRLLRYDNRGHGRSAVSPAPYTMEQLATDIAAILDHHAVARTHFVGLSLGGMIGQTLALQRPDLIASLCLVATSPARPYADRRIWDERITLVRRENGFASMLSGMMDRWISMRLRREQPEAYKAVLAMVTGTPPEGYIGCCEAIAGFDVSERLHEVSCPTLIIAGGEDPGTTVEDAELIHTRIVGSELAVIPEGRHLLNVDRREAFDQLLDGWIARQVGSSERGKERRA